MRVIPFLLLAIVACAHDADVGQDDVAEEGDPPPEDEQGKEDDPSDAVTPPPPGSGSVRVVQLNPYYAGRLAPYTTYTNSCSRTTECAVSGRLACTSTTQANCYECVDSRCRNRNWETMTHAAELLGAINADVVGIEELNGAYVQKVNAILESKTGKDWDYRYSQQGINGTGSGNGVFWRTDRVELVADLGYVTVDTLSTNYLLRFHGAILRDKASQNSFGFFAGKHVWGSGGDDEDRRLQAVKLRMWMDAKMSQYPEASARILATDLNDSIGSPAYNVFASYDDGDAVKPTSSGASPTQRLDYLFWADGKGGASQQGFVTARSDNRLGRSMFFGSDHRFVYGDALIP